MTGSLIKKEIHLQKSNISFILVVYILWGLNLIFLLTGDQTIIASLLTTHQLAQIIHYFFILPCLVIVFPLLLGTTTIATERKLGILDLQFTLPVSRKRQFMIKMGCGILLTVLLGIFASILMERILIEISQKKEIFSILEFEKQTINAFKPRGLNPGIFALLFFSAGVYISSLYKEPYRALMASGVFLSVSLVAQRVIDPGWMLVPLGSHFPLNYLHPHAHHVSVIIFSLFLLILSFPNFHVSLPRLKHMAVQFFLWFLFLNCVGFFVLKAEFSFNTLPEKKKSQTRGVTKLLENENLVLPSPIYSLPDSPLLIATAKNIKDEIRYPERSAGWDKYSHVLEINLEKETSRQISLLFCIPENYPPDEDFYVIKNIPDPLYFEKKSPIIIPFYWEKLLRKIKLDSPYQEDWLYRFAPHHTKNFKNKIKRNGETAHLNGSFLYYGNYQNLWYYYNRKEKSKKQYLLMRRTSDDVFEIIDEKKVWTRFWVSSDAKWYSRERWAYPKDWFLALFPENHDTIKYQPIEIINIETRKTHTLHSQGKIIIVADHEPFFFYIHSPFLNFGGTIFDPALLSVSPNGKYLAFIRLPYQKGENEKTFFPGAFTGDLEICVLNLDSGEIILIDTLKQSNFLKHRIKRFLKRWNRFRNKKLYHETIDSFFHSLDYHFFMLPMAWHREEKLAVYNDGNLRIYNITKRGNNFTLESTINLEEDLSESKEHFEYFEYYGFKVSLSFWSSEVLILLNKSNNSLWKIDLTRLKKD